MRKYKSTVIQRACWNFAAIFCWFGAEEKRRLCGEKNSVLFGKLVFVGETVFFCVRKSILCVQNLFLLLPKLVIFFVRFGESPVCAGGRKPVCEAISVILSIISVDFLIVCMREVCSTYQELRSPEGLLRYIPFVLRCGVLDWSNFPNSDFGLVNWVSERARGRVRDRGECDLYRMLVNKRGVLGFFCLVFWSCCTLRWCATAIVCTYGTTGTLLKEHGELRKTTRINQQQSNPTMASLVTQFEKLTKDNYRSWRSRMRGLLLEQDCWQFVEEPLPAAPTPEQRKGNRKAMGLILEVVDDSALEEIDACVTAQDMWQTLDRTRGHCDSWHGMTATYEFATSKKKEDESMQDYWNRKAELLFKAKGAGMAVPNPQAATHILFGLPAKYNYLKRTIKVADPTFDLMKLKAALFEAEGVNLAIEKTDDEAKAYTMGVQKKPPWKYDQRAGKFRERVESKRYPREELNRDRRFQVQRGVRCYNCQGRGHIGRDCPSPKFEHKPKPKSKEETKKPEQPAEDAAVAWATASITRRMANWNIQWLLDTGATHHMTSDKTRFGKDFQQVETKVKMADGSRVTSTGRGSIVVRLETRDGEYKVRLEDTLFVPELDGNLMSGRKIVKRGNTIEVLEDCAIIRNAEGVQVAEAKQEEELYFLKEAKVAGEAQAENDKKREEVAHIGVSEEDKRKWHRRLGHLHKRAVRETMGFDKEEEERCEICLECKITAAPFPKHKAMRAEQPLEVIHSDLMDAGSTLARSGEKYVLTFIDDYSRYGISYFLKRKDETFEKFQEYHKYVETQLGKQVKALRSDGGGEYISTEFANYLKQHGIKRQVTIPHTPQQNGVAERRNRTLCEMSRCLLNESGLPLNFWKEAVACSTYLRNRVTQKMSEGITPYERWYGRAPEMGHLRVFGCCVWYKPKSPKTKFEPRGAKGIFLGYATEAKGYRIYDLEAEKIVVSRDVVFDEEKFPAVDGLSRKTKIGEAIPRDGILDSVFIHHHGHQGMVKEPQLRANDEVFNLQGEHEEAEEMPPPRKRTRAGRETKLPSWSKDYCFMAQTPEGETMPDAQDPMNIEEVNSSPNKDEWTKGIDEEFQNMFRNKVWEFVKRPEKTKILKTKWAFKTKVDDTGKPARYKARLVALGNLQRPGLDYNNTFSPVVKARTVRILTALAVEKGWSIHHVDIKAAYLNAELKEQAYIEIPEGLQEFLERNGQMDCVPSCDELRNGNWVIRLKKCMYGLHQSGRTWNEKIDAELLAMGLTRCKADPCVYYSTMLGIIITTYVDDLLFFGEEKRIIQMKRKIEGVFEIRDLGKATLVQSVRISQKTNQIDMDQEMYARSILREFGMENCRDANTPLPPGARYHKASEENKLDEHTASRYRTLIGSLMYLVTGSRPDLAFAVTYLSQFCSAPSMEHWKGAKHVLRYLHKTATTKLRYTRKEANIVAYTDADWAGDPIDRKSFSGYVTLFAGGATSWSSKKQTMTALSTTEAEFVAISEGTKECMWQQHLLFEIGFGEYCGKPTTVFADNQGAINLAVNHVASERTKHLQLKKFFVQEACDEGIITLSYVQSDRNVADPLTKPIDRLKLVDHCKSLGLVDQGGNVSGFE